MTIVQTTQATETLAAAARQFEAGQAHQAMQLCAALIRSQPGCITGRLLVARGALSLGNAAVALEHIDAATWYIQREAGDEAHDQWIEQLLLRGQALMQMSRPEDACMVWRGVLTVEPRHARALRLLAAAYEQLKNYDQAIACIEHLLLMTRPGEIPAQADDGRDVPTLKLLIDLCELDHQHQRALSLLEQYGLMEESALQWQVIRLLRQVDRKHEAMDRLTVLCRREPDDVTLAMTAAELAGELGHESLMLRHANRLKADQQAKIASMTAMATHAQRVGRLARAGRLWWMISRCATESSDQARAAALANLAVCATVLGHDRTALRAAESIKRLVDQTQYDTLLAEAWLETTPGRLMMEQQLGAVGGTSAAGTEQSVLSMLLHEAAATLELRAEQKTGYADVHHHLSICQWKLGHADRAAINSDRALHINPGYAQAAIQRARLLVEEGAGEAALAVLNAALSRKPDHVEMAAMAGALEVMTGRWKQAVARLTGDENRLQLRQSIGTWLEQLGRDNEAVQWRNAA